MTATMSGHAPIGADVLTRAEAIALSDCEDRIERGMKTFIEVGMALAAIQQNRLYRAQHDTFEEYCAARWNFTGRRGRQLIEAAAIGTIVPVENEGQARELAKVPAEERADVLAEATDRTGGKPTAKVIREVAKERAEPTPEPEPDLRPYVLEVLSDAGGEGRTAWQIAFLLDPADPDEDAVTDALERLVEAGQVDPAGRGLRGNHMVPLWALAELVDTQTPEPAAPVDVPTVAAGSGPTSPAPEPEPKEDPAVVPPKPTLSLAPDVDEKRAAERRDARALLSRAVDLLAPVNRKPGWVEVWLDQLGAYDDELSELVARAREAIAVLDELIEGCGR